MAGRCVASNEAVTFLLVTKGNLTQKELGWLLAQEAKGAAERVRMSVQFLRSSAMPPPPEPTDASSDPTGAEPVEATLDALDDAMRMLGALHQRAPRGRRGRTDLAALLWELAPEARVALEPGAGTEVYGDEEDFRRMLQVLLGGTATNSGAEVSVRRDGERVAVAVPLGSEGSLVAESERAWLSRMALRYGGQYEIHGQEAVLTLPADGARERAEREALQRELDEARKQGEVYAKELAVALSHRKKDQSVPPPSGDLHGVGVVAQMARGIAAELRDLVAPLARDLSLRPPQDDETGRALRGRTARVQEFVADLASLGDLDVDEDAREINLTELVARASGSPRLQLGDDVLVRAAPRLVQELLRSFVALGRAAGDAGSAPELTTTGDSFRLLFEAREGSAATLPPLRVFVVNRLAAALDWFCEIGPRAEGGSHLTLRGARAVPSSSPSVAPPSK